MSTPVGLGSVITRRRNFNGFLYVLVFFTRKVSRDVVCCARQLSAGSSNGSIVFVACRDPPQSGETSTISSPLRKRSLVRWVLEVINTVWPRQLRIMEESGVFS